MPDTRRTDPPGESISELVAKLKRDTGRYLPATVVPAMASVAAVAIFTRMFGSAEYGRYALVIATVGILVVLLSGWVQQAILRYLPRAAADGDVSAFIARTRGLLALICLSVTVVLATGYYATRPWLGVYDPLVLPALLLLITEIALLNLNTIFQAQLRARHYAAYRAAGAVLRLAFALGFLWLVRRDVPGLIMGAALGQLLVLIPMWGAAKARFVSFDSSLLRTFAAYGIPLIAWGLGGQLLGFSDRFIIAAFRDSAEVGIYSANYSLAHMGFGLVTAPLLMASHPLIVSAWESRRGEGVSSVITTFSRYYFLLALPVVVLVSVFSEEIARLFVGADFREGHRIIPFVLAGSLVWGASMYGHKTLELAENTRAMLLMVLAAAAINIVLNLLFVPRFGYFAAAVTTFVGYLTYPVMVYFVTRKTMPWRVPWGSLARGLLAALFSGAAAFALKRAIPESVPVAVTIAAGAVTGLVLYAALLILFGELSRNDRDE
ncbi:MAG: lipopolysaccharide biosynthesis protein [Candidatus Krumholzibacteriota bacterium]|nr:lipopolysaccharide biosynthesis protein [Candidatus Krumholzibacteriota bacterium]